MRRLWNWVSHAATAWGLMPSAWATYVTTAIWATAMSIAGYAQGVPIMWIMMAIPLAAAGFVTLAIRTAEWREKTNPEDKLKFLGIQLAGDYRKDGKGKIVALNRMQVRLLFHNAASFPINFIVDEYSSSFDGRVPPAAPWDNKSGLMTPGEIKFFADHPVEMGSLPIKDGQIEGVAKFVVKYGPLGREQSVIDKHIRFQAIFNKDAGGYISPGWTDVVQ
jgi:hypothetical protein